MFCKNCGAKLSEGAAFCGKCGSPVRSADRPLYAQARKKPMGMKWVVCGIAAAVIIVISVVLIAHLSDKGRSGQGDLSDGEYSERNGSFVRGYSDQTDLLVAFQDAFNSHDIDSLVSMSSDIFDINDAALRMVYDRELEQFDDLYGIGWKCSLDLEDLDVEYIDANYIKNSVNYIIDNLDDIDEIYHVEITEAQIDAIIDALDNISQFAAVLPTAYISLRNTPGGSQGGQETTYPKIIMANEDGYWKLFIAEF